MLLDSPRVRSRLDLLYAVTREFNAGLDIDQVLNRVLFATLATVGVSDASLFLFDLDGELEKFFLINDFEVVNRSRPMVEAILKQGLVSWVKENRQGVIINDTRTDERWYSDNEYKFLRAASAIAVPIQLPEQLIGIITITAPRPNHFDQSDLAMLTIMADQAAFAITNARLFKAEQQRRQYASTLTSIARTINSTLNLNEVLNLTLEQLGLVIEYDSASIMLFDEDNQTLSVRAARSFDDMEDALRVTIPITENSPNYRAVKQKSPVVISNVDAEPGWIKSASTRRVKSWIGAPLVARNRVVGMLTVDSHQPNQYTPEHAHEVAAFADLAATAVANAQTVAQLRNTEASYTTLFEDSTDLIVITTYQGAILNVNRRACQMLRRTKEDLINGDIKFISPALNNFLDKEASRLKAWREASVELEIEDAYHRPIALEFKVRQVHYNRQDCVQWVGRDISMRKETERLRQDLLNMVVHDLRGPVGNLINAIEVLSVLQVNPTDTAAIQNILEMALQTGQQVRDLVDSMLDVSRLEQGEIPLQRRPVNIQRLLQTVHKQVSPRAADKEIRLVINRLPEIPDMWIDNSMIRRVLINLLDNAIKYTPAGGDVSLTTTLARNTVTFAVADNGPGISKADQTHIFDKFARLNYAKDAPRGVGLGLAFCKLAAEAHGGTVSVESEGISGRGSTFYLSLPLVTEPTP